MQGCSSRLSRTSVPTAASPTPSSPAAATAPKTLVPPPSPPSPCHHPHRSTTATTAPPFLNPLPPLCPAGSHLDATHVPSLAMATGCLVAIKVWPKEWAKVRSGVGRWRGGARRGAAAPMADGFWISQKGCCARRQGGVR